MIPAYNAVRNLLISMGLQDKNTLIMEVYNQVNSVCGLENAERRLDAILRLHPDIHYDSETQTYSFRDYN